MDGWIAGAAIGVTDQWTGGRGSMRDRRAPRSLYEHLDFTLGSCPCRPMQCSDVCTVIAEGVSLCECECGYALSFHRSLQLFSATLGPSSHAPPPPAARLKFSGFRICMMNAQHLGLVLPRGCPNRFGGLLWTNHARADGHCEAAAMQSIMIYDLEKNSNAIPRFPAAFSRPVRSHQTDF
jgi:hypothetical protein